MLTLAEKGAWIDILCGLWRSPTRGTLTLPVIEWARLVGATVDQTVTVLTGLIERKVMDASHGCKSVMTVTSSLKDLTLSSRRILREEEKKKLNRARVEKYRGKQADTDFIAALKANTAYAHINIDHELSRMDAWLLLPKAHGRTKTRQFILNWLNKVERPVTTKDWRQGE